jgi:6-phosphogluconolactonase
MGRGAKALAVSLALILGVSACSRDYTVAYLYVTAKTAGTTGLINAYAIDYQSGSLEPLADSPIPSGGRNPNGIAVMPDGTGLFVINHDDSSIVSFNIGTDGKLYPQTTYFTCNSPCTVGGTFPTALAVDGQGKFLYVTYTYQPAFGPASPGAGGMIVFAITEKTNPTTVTLTQVANVALGNNPVGVAVGKSSVTQPNTFVYAVDQEKNSAGAAFGVIRVFQQIVSSSGALTVTSIDTKSTVPFTTGTCTSGATTVQGFCAGSLPNAVVVDPTQRFVYVSDGSTNQIYLNTVGTGGILLPYVNGPTLTGQLPMGMTIDPRGTFLFVANYNSNTVGGYTINAITGSLTATGTALVATGPTCVTMENSLGQYLFTSNQLDDSVSGERMDVHTGGLTAIQGTQFTASHLPTCAAAIANGSHATALTAY